MDQAALPTTHVEYDPTIEETGDISEMSAEQYLSWVMQQASDLPGVVRVDIDVSQYKNRQSEYMPQIEEIAVCPPEFLPSEDWIRETLYSFSCLRSNLHDFSMMDEAKERKLAVPQMKDADGWTRFCLGITLEKDAKCVGNNKMNEEGRERFLGNLEIKNDIEIEKSTLISKRKRELAEKFGIGTDAADEFNEEDTNDNSCDDIEAEVEPTDLPFYCLINDRMRWVGSEKVTPTTSLLLQFDQVLTAKLLAYHTEWMEDCHLSPRRSQWLYSLLARIEKPVHIDSVAMIRQLYRRCCFLRSTLCVNSEGFDTELAFLNVLITVCGSYFGQGEEYASFNEGGSRGDDEDGEGLWLQSEEPDDLMKTGNWDIDDDEYQDTGGQDGEDSDIVAKKRRHNDEQSNNSTDCSGMHGSDEMTELEDGEEGEDQSNLER